jgi:hypothetical protein
MSLQGVIPFTNKRLKKIINVYQKKDKSHKTYGFGDFLRGCFCLIQICNKLGIEFDFDISQHPVSKYIVSKENARVNMINYNKIEHFANINYVCEDGKTNTSNRRAFYYEFISHLNKLDNDTENYYLECNSFPAWKSITFLERQILKYKLTPTRDMQKYIDDTLKKVYLNGASFGIIHIRTGDECLMNGATLEPQKLTKILNALTLVTDKTKKYLLISDNNLLKAKLKTIFPNISCYIFPITHLGESTNQTNDSLKNTMLDFFIIGTSKLVINLSFHNWGSGFSEWASVMYGIPYKKFIL